MIYKDGYKIRLILHDSQIRTLSRYLNGTEVEVCTLDYTARSHAPSTTFNLDRFSYRQDISRDTIRVSKTLLKEALANITISALTINKWYQLVNGTMSYNYATYRFDNKFSFFPPYGLSQLLILPVIFFGLLALRNNGVLAIDGGFLQILMTATGNNKLRRLAQQVSLGRA
ncbi:hypothetical protein HBI31_131160 [Parastagonospora nodorum]|nr:hypothetical protein HBI31_131160 [Parastagonospora nodorum]